MTISFYPGPSQVYPQVRTFLTDAYDSGILSVNHRSAPAMELVEATFGLLREKLLVPADYHIAFVSSATECWEIIAQSLVRKSAVHAYNGAFGHKWAEYARKLGVEVTEVPFSPEGELALQELATDVLCITQNETSNGTQVSMPVLRQLREQVPGLIAVDATSSMAGIAFDWSLGDIWYASVQKCFGLPAGMAVLICSPAAIARAQELNERNHYNSLVFIDENFRKFQTPYTPNVLGIYLLKRVLETVPVITETDTKIRLRARELYHFFGRQPDWQLLTPSAAVRSDTVLTIAGDTNRIRDWKQFAAERGVLVGNGYGNWKESTFRIANFPALQDTDFTELYRLITAFA